MDSPHAATRQTAQTPLAANAARPLDLIDASPVPLVAAASAGGGMTWPLPRRRPPANGDRKQRHGSGQLRDCMRYGATKWA